MQPGAEGVGLVATKCETASALKGRANHVSVVVVSPAVHGRDIMQNRDEPGLGVRRNSGHPAGLAGGLPAGGISSDYLGQLRHGLVVGLYSLDLCQKEETEHRPWPEAQGFAI